MDAGVFVSRNEAESTSFAKALEMYAEQVTSKKRSSDSELSRIQALQRHPLALRSLASIRGADMASYRDQRLAAGLAAATVRRELALISHVFTIARKEWRMESLSNPVELIRQPSVDDARDRRIRSAEVWTQKDGKLICEHMDELEMICRHSRSIELPKIVAFAVETAMRRSEISGLLRANVNLTKRVALLPMTKNGSARGVPLSSKAVEILESLAEHNDGRCFKSQPDSITKAFADAISDARSSYTEGLRLHLKQKKFAQEKIENYIADTSFLVDLRFHDLRHEAISRLAGYFPLHELTKITGHQDTRMLMRYYHPKAEDLARKLM
ncbi:tyrosine-type recombinase/integrase [Pseudomonas aeruginosa]|uniref:tyrosine-type recombinase/integrase n=1 Tax=Pseudomonas aeruginosa TaxID=287 RepID=UPI0020437100|nr:site-specific integrase [Pseudomonas aeruginosa]MCM3970316.1 site-specific integrase [Pseudomonas aeruginosa]MCM4036965.1 site-specific integrase [Pseudomonas aeruginosa]MCM4054664.1 site-specific integrase [Pseudomonas aeruginosa]